jgi:DNA-binding response OmpR family regulator
MQAGLVQRGNRVLVADDDVVLGSLVAFSLRQAGFSAEAVHNGRAALQALETGGSDLLVLDSNMPDVDGVEVCREVRARSALPIVMLTARDHEDDLLTAFDSGADDCISKPLSMRTLVARVKALLRRSGPQYSESSVDGVFSLHVEQHTLQVAGAKSVLLTPLETKVMQVLLAAGGRTVPSERLLLHVWGRTSLNERRTLKQLIYRLRHKLMQQTGFTDAVQTTPSSGYRLVTGHESADRHEGNTLTVASTHEYE